MRRLRTRIAMWIAPNPAPVTSVDAIAALAQQVQENNDHILALKASVIFDGNTMIDAVNAGLGPRISMGAASRKPQSPRY